MPKMLAGDAIRLHKELQDATTMFRNWVHAMTTEQKELMHKAFGGHDTIPWYDIAKSLTAVLDAAEMTSTRLSIVLSKTEVDV